MASWASIPLQGFPFCKCSFASAASMTLCAEFLPNSALLDEAVAESPTIPDEGFEIQRGGDTYDFEGEAHVAARIGIATLRQSFYCWYRCFWQRAGCVLLQYGEECPTKAIEYCSGSLIYVDCPYNTIRWQFLTVVRGVLLFVPSLWGTELFVRTDHYGLK